MVTETPAREEIKPQWRARLEDSLSASTRAKRRLLLVVSTISLVVVFLRLFPTKIEALGIAFEKANQTDLLTLLAVVHGYALVGFFIYAWADVQLQLRIQRNAATGYIHEFVKGKASFGESFNYLLRFAFDLCVPPIYGTYAFYRLFEFVYFSTAAAS